MGAALLLRRADAHGQALSVRSAGISALEGEPVVPLAVAVLRDDWAIDIAAHCSHRVERADIDDADLIVAMERWIAKEIVLMSPGAASRTFTFRGLARVAGSTPRRSGEPTRGWVERLDRREPVDARLLGAPADDIADPTNAPLSAYRRTASELDALTASILGGAP